MSESERRAASGEGSEPATELTIQQFQFHLQTQFAVSGNNQGFKMFGALLVIKRMIRRKVGARRQQLGGGGGGWG